MRNIFLSLRAVFMALMLGSGMVAYAQVAANGDVTDAANGEFMNLNNGLFVVNISNERNTEIKLQPPVVVRDGTIEGPVYRIAVVFPFGTVSFYITVK